MLLSFFFAASATGQDKTQRASPPAVATGSIGEATISINYSSPAMKGRTVWGGIVPYGKVWRAGANEATTFETDKDIMVEGEKLAAGKYSIFAIPQEGDWTIIFNTVAEQWGAYQYDESKDALRVTVTPTMADKSVEKLTYGVDSKNGKVHLMWDKVVVPVSIK